MRSRQGPARCPLRTSRSRGGGERRLAPLWGLHPGHTGLLSRRLAGLQHCPAVASRPCFLPLQDGEPGARCVLTLAKATLPWTRFLPATPPHLLPETLHPYEPPGVRPHCGLGSPWEAPVSTAQRPSLVEVPLQAPHPWSPRAGGRHAPPCGGRGSQQVWTVLSPATPSPRHPQAVASEHIWEEQLPHGPGPAPLAWHSRWRHRDPSAEGPQSPQRIPRPDTREGPSQSPMHLEGGDRAHLTSGRATYSGDDSGVRLDISSGVGTAHGKDGESVVTTPPFPHQGACAAGGVSGAMALSPAPTGTGQLPAPTRPREPRATGSCPAFWC